MLCWLFRSGKGAGLDRRSRVTHRVRTCRGAPQVLPIAHVAQLTGLYWHAIKAVNHQRLERLQGGFAADDVNRLVVGEFALHKGHRYATAIMGVQRMRGVCVDEGNRRETILY